MSAVDARPAANALVLVAADVARGVRDAVMARYPVHVVPGPPERGVRALAEAERERACVLVARGSASIGAPVFDALRALRLVACVGTGYEGIDTRAAASRGIAVTHSPGANSASVADLAIGLMIAVVRGIVECDAIMRRGTWPGADGTLRRQWRSLSGMNVGVFGMGAIGRKIADRARALEMNVAWHGRRPRADATDPYQPSLVELARWADVLVIAARASAGNRGVVDADVLRALGADGYLVNIARGSIVDEAALVHALRTRAIAGAALDVFATEPRVLPELLAMPNVVVTPHIGGDTDASESVMASMVVANLDALWRGEPMRSPVPDDVAA